MPIQSVSFGLESRPGRYGPDGGARLINAFVEQGAADAKSPWEIYCRPGLVDFADLEGGTGFRGGLTFGSVAYVVNGTVVNKVDSSGNVTNVGSFPGSSPVFMARNRKSPNAQIAIVSGGHKAIIENDVVADIADEDLPPPIGVCSIGGFFVFAIDNGQYWWTTIDEGTAIDDLDFATAEANPDGLVGIIDRNQEIILFGTKSIEFHALTGSANVFDRVQQTTIQIGCLSGAAVKSLNGVVVFPASDGTVRMLNDYSPERISNHDVERDIRKLADKTSLTAQVFSLDGHQYYCLNSAEWTWVCDLLTNKWFNWISYGLDRWRAEGYVEIGGKMCVGDYNQAKMYEIDPEAFDDAGDNLIWKLVSGSVGGFPSRLIADELYVDVLPGVGLGSGPLSDKAPQIILRTSDDDGQNWSDEMLQYVGRQGETRTDVSFTNLGVTGEDGMRFELSMSARVRRGLTGASLRYIPLGP